MPATEFEEWFQRYHEQPFGTKRDNMHAAIIAATIRNVFRSKDSKAVDWKDFLFVQESEHRKSALGNAVNQLIAMAVPKAQAKKQKARSKKRDRSRKASRKARS